jgi:hypothetical protein
VQTAEARGINSKSGLKAQDPKENNEKGKKFVKM